MAEEARKTAEPVLSFTTQDAWEEWLEENHADVPGVWLKIPKAGSGLVGVDYAQALESALCHGWIDGQKKKLDEKNWLQRFTPRRRGSSWSQVNRQKATGLIERGRMRPAGLREVEKAKADGRWEAAYASQSKATVPDGPRVLRHAGQPQPVRDPLPGAGREEAADTGGPHREVRRHARRRQEALPLTARHAARGRCRPGAYAPRPRRAVSMGSGGRSGSAGGS
jgi:uncharacterized protein YdeI (YjbR/CyaY-like superfamily)